MRAPKHIKLEIKGKGGRAKAKMTCHACGKVQPAETDAHVELWQNFIKDHRGCKTKGG